MKNIINKLSVVSMSIAILASSCKPEKDLIAPEITAGNLNVGTYVAIGNSLTSGYQDNGLSYEGQKSSYVNLLAGQFRKVNPNLVFTTPFVDAASVGCGGPSLDIQPPLSADIATNPFPYLSVTFSLTITVDAPLSLQNTTNCDGSKGLAPAPKEDKGDITVILDPTNQGYNAATKSIRRTFTILDLAGGSFPSIKTAPSIYANGGSHGEPAGPYHNMGVPGVRAIEVNKKGLGGADLISLNGTAISQSNPFFSRFAKDKANSSILSDAMALKPTFFTLFIGNNDVLLWASQGGANTALSTPRTPVQEFSDSIDVIVNTLTTSASQGVVIGISQITGAAYFTYNKPDVTKYMVDESGAVRLMRSDDLLLLTVPQDSLKCELPNAAGQKFGSNLYPISKQYTLTKLQQDTVISTIDGYNAKLKAKAEEKGLAYFDMDAFTRQNQGGAVYNGMSFDGEFVSGGIFSLDGLHLTPRGYAALANELVKVINTKYGSTMPGIDLTKYKGVTFPND